MILKNKQLNPLIYVNLKKKILKFLNSWTNLIKIKKLLPLSILMEIIIVALIIIIIIIMIIAVLMVIITT